MKHEENCMECGNNEFEHDDVRSEYHCTFCGCIVEDQLDSNPAQFMNSEGQIERELNSNRLGADERQTWLNTRDASGKPVVYNRQQRLRNRNFDRNSRSERTWLKTDVERLIDSPNMPGIRTMKTLAKKILSQTHSTEEHAKRMANSVTWKAMKDANYGQDVPLPLNQTRHAQKTSKDDTRNGNYSTRMIAIATLNIAARIMGIELPTRQLSNVFDVEHDHVIRESTNIKKYLIIIWKAEALIVEQGNQIKSLPRMGIPQGNLQSRIWSESDIRAAIDDLRPSLEKKFGTMTARLMITEIWAMLEEARDHTYLSGQNIRLVAAGLTVRSTQARGVSRLKQRIADWLGITTTRLKRLEKDYSLVMDAIFNNHNSATR
ncbi:MAG: hypothetical protein CMB31_00595 [Euryarchaeota archaeon]|nr:hypothetical protein [Euryarchaeota archaeon]